MGVQIDSPGLRDASDMFRASLVYLGGPKNEVTGSYMQYKSEKSIRVGSA